MSTTHFDTLRYVESLIAAGLAPDAAKASATALNEAISQAVDSALATRQDISNLRAYVKQDISDLRNETKLEFADVKSELRLHRWMLGATFAMGTALFIRSFF